MDLLSLIFPRRCVGCGTLGNYLCSDCMNHITPLDTLYCPVCRKPSLFGVTHPRCRTHYGIDGLMSCFKYQGIMKQIVSQFKYQFVTDLTDTLIELMISQCMFPVLQQDRWCLLPVPLHHDRLKWRGFNQAEVLSDGLAENWQWGREATLLQRVRKTKPQMSLSGDERRSNLSGAFQINPHFEHRFPTSVLLIDDVATTCSTLLECAHVLKRSGVIDVWGLTLAQAIPGTKHKQY